MFGSLIDHKFETFSDRPSAAYFRELSASTIFNYHLIPAQQAGWLVRCFVCIVIVSLSFLVLAVL